MQTFKRICIKDYTITEQDKTLTIKRGKEYTTTPEDNGIVTVFTMYWAQVPCNIFAGEIRFT